MIDVAKLLDQLTSSACQSLHATSPKQFNSATSTRSVTRRTSTSSRQVRLVKIFQWPVTGVVSMANKVVCFSKQLSLFDESTLNSLCGRTFPARSVQTAGMILGQDSKKSPKSPFLYLNTGQTQEWLTADTCKFAGESSTLNIGAFPNVAVESSLSRILQVDAPPKYFLSGKACAGILRRARAKNVKLPTELEAALIRQATVFKATQSTGS